VLRRRLQSAAILCLLASALAAAGCGGEDSDTADKSAQESPEEAVREGLFTDIGGLDYNVYITRELNLKDVEDKAYFAGPEPPPGSALYGVFLRVCNEGDEPRSSAADFKIRDTQGGEYEPLELPADNAFAYRPGKIEGKTCFPEDGSVAALGPTGGSLLLFELPNAAAENRPLELEIRAPLDVASGEQPERAIELDL
jgi:hypothetical protein